MRLAITVKTRELQYYNLFCSDMMKYAPEMSFEQNRALINLKRAENWKDVTSILLAADFHKLKPFTTLRGIS